MVLRLSTPPSCIMSLLLCCLYCCSHFHQPLLALLLFYRLFSSLLEILHSSTDINLIGILLYMIHCSFALELSLLNFSILSVICLSVGLFGFILLETLYLEYLFPFQVCAGSSPLLSVQQDSVGAGSGPSCWRKEALRDRSELVRILTSVCLHLPAATAPSTQGSGA